MEAWFSWQYQRGMSSVRTLIVDDNENMRRVLRSVVNGYHGIEVVGEAGNGEEAIQKTANLSPDLIIMDVSMPVLDGLTAAELVKKNRPDANIVIFSIHRIRDFVESAKSMGLAGFVCKDQGGQVLLSAVDAVLDHRTYFPR
jgi:two-component system nitrate/nitrite response regulator NarL